MRRVLNSFLASVKYALKGSHDRKYPETYIEELEYQNERLVPFAIITCIVAWLPYIPVDRLNHPEQPALLWLRLGLSGAAVTGLILSRLKPGRFWAIGANTFGCFYITAGAGVAAILSGGDPAYTGGFGICLTMVSLMAPLPYWLLTLLLTLTYVIFAFGVIFTGISFHSNAQKYSLQDLSTVVFISYAVGYIQHRVRRTHYFRAIEIERQKSESNRLLLNILPERIADELKASGATKPSRIGCATVMFTDFVGFTRISEKLTPEEVVDELDKCFSYFDQVTEKYGLEKLKTIGDSFMCAGGLPTANNTHAIDCCLAALEIQAFMNQMKDIKHQQSFDYWELRLGINTGPLVAGVVGHKKFAYDVWGDTVNTASRLESSGVPGKINISLSTHEAVKHFFDCEHRGQVKAKNKGDIDMYFLNGILPALSVNGEGRVPNAKFKMNYGKLQSDNLT